MEYIKFVYSKSYTATMLAFSIGLAGCVSRPIPQDRYSSNVIFEYLESNSTRIFGDCNILVNLENSNNVSINNSLDCSAIRNKGKTDAGYCMQNSQIEFIKLYPSGLLTLPLFPVFALTNYISEKSAEKDADEIFTACMITRGHIKNGYGIYTFENGNKYQGQWKEWKFDGKGTFYWKDGGSYDGQWNDGLKSGVGFDIYSDGVTYKGAFKNNMKNGYGVMKWPDGRRFEGIFCDNRPEGRGVFVDAKGQRFEGNWSNGCFEDGDRWAVVNQRNEYCR